jgi:hypothetical protein
MLMTPNAVNALTHWCFRQRDGLVQVQQELTAYMDKAERHRSKAKRFKYGGIATGLMCSGAALFVAIDLCTTGGLITLTSTAVAAAVGSGGGAAAAATNAIGNSMAHNRKEMALRQMDLATAAKSTFEQLTRAVEKTVQRYQRAYRQACNSYLCTHVHDG